MRSLHAFASASTRICDSYSTPNRELIKKSFAGTLKANETDKALRNYLSLGLYMSHSNGPEGSLVMPMLKIKTVQRLLGQRDSFWRDALLVPAESLGRTARAVRAGESSGGFECLKRGQ